MQTAAGKDAGWPTGSSNQQYKLRWRPCLTLHCQIAVIQVQPVVPECMLMTGCKPGPAGKDALSTGVLGHPSVST
jgi:hypothetical protein